LGGGQRFALAEPLGSVDASNVVGEKFFVSLIIVSYYI